jgi:hypothetical protein
MRKLVLMAFLVLATHTANAQWVNYKAPGTPRLPDGRPNLAARAPRAADGKPDLSGVWHVQPNTREEMKKLFGNDVDTIEVPGMEIDTVSKYGINILQDFKREDWPMKPAGFMVMKQRAEGGPEAFPPTHCLPAGIPISTMLSEVSKIVQTPGLIVIMLELGGTRQIYTDGRKHMADPSPSWLGYSVGRWEGETLVVETIGFNGKSWLDIIGHPQSEATRLTERYRRRDFGHMDIEMTIDDSTYYTKPFTVKVTHELQADDDILEYFCNENEQDRKRMGL